MLYCLLRLLAIFSTLAASTCFAFSLIFVLTFLLLSSMSLVSLSPLLHVSGQSGHALVRELKWVEKPLGSGHI